MKKRGRVRSVDRAASRAPIPFGQRIAWRRYIWNPPVGGKRYVELEIGTPVQVDDQEWACPFRIKGLPKEIDTAAHGIDAVQALELALRGAGVLLSRSPQFRAHQIEMFDAPLKGAAQLSLPLPMNSIQGTLENLQAYLERQQEKERRTKRDWFDPEWRRGLLSAMNDIKGDLATLAAYLPIRPPPLRRHRPASSRRSGPGKRRRR
jgi:hypothetical protein